MIHIQEARVLLIDAVDTKGSDFVYNPHGVYGCYYLPNPNSALVPQQETGCLIGTALLLSKSIEPKELETCNFANVSSLAKNFPHLMSKRTIKYFGVAQKTQDDGGTWGMAYVAAELSLVQ